MSQNRSRPKLVEVGKPISEHQSDNDDITMLQQEYKNRFTKEQRSTDSSLQSSLARRKTHFSSSSGYKLKTSMVIGSSFVESKKQSHSNDSYAPEQCLGGDYHGLEQDDETMGVSDAGLKEGRPPRDGVGSLQYEPSLSQIYNRDGQPMNSRKLTTSFEIGGNRIDDGYGDDDVNMDIHHDSHLSLANNESSFNTPLLHNLNQESQSSLFVNQAIAQMTSLNNPTRMEIDDSLPKSPLVVIDGANVAYAYSQVLNAKSSLSLAGSNSTIEPDVRGIKIAADYFLNAGCRIQIVIPMYWLRKKPRQGDNSSDNALMMTEQVEILEKLQAQNLLLCSPPTDDDDAYAITIARREDRRSVRRHSSNQTSLQINASTSTDVMSIHGAFILSNDLFRDAMKRDVSGNLQQWLHGLELNSIPARISYSFCDIGCMDLDFVANPRYVCHDLFSCRLPITYVSNIHV